MINYRNSKNATYQTFFRKLTPELPKESYQASHVFNCHDGQRKLLFSEIEFYNLVSQKYNLKDCIVVYVGSGEGVHMSFIFDLFPDLDFILIDPVKSLCKHPFMKNKEKVIQINEYYTDHSYKKILELNKKNKKILFMSDIREEASEKEIWSDMLQQQLWCIQLNSIAYLLKFRLPWITEDFNFNDFDYLLPLSSEKSKYDFKEKDKGIKYLKGDIYLQIYPPVKSTETRLIHIRDNDEKFTFYKYDPKFYEDQMFYFNTKSRLQSFKYKDSELMKYHLIGYDDSYESVSEYFIIEQYLNTYYKSIQQYNYNNYNNKLLRIISENKNKKESDIIIHILNYLNLESIQLTNKDLITCSFRTSIRKDKIPEFIKDENKLIKINDFIEIIKGKYFNTILSMKKQIEYFTKGDILNKDDYVYQIDLMKDVLEILNYYMKIILERKYTKKNISYFLTKEILDYDNEFLSKYLEKNKTKQIQSFMINEIQENQQAKDSKNLELFKNILKELKHIKKEYKTISKINS